MPVMKDRIGQKFGRLTVTEFAGVRGRRRSYYKCICDCGVEKVFCIDNVVSGKSTSCGCYRNEQIEATCGTHGQTGSRLHRTWISMKTRCYNPNKTKFIDYGGRGIKVCERWLNSFENFCADMGEPPSKDHSLDRIDVDGDYSPENCKWSTRSEQMINRRPSAKVKEDRKYFEEHKEEFLSKLPPASNRRKPYNGSPRY